MGRIKSTLTVFLPSRRTRVCIADPYPVIVHGMRKMVEDDLRFQVVAEAFTLPSFHRKVKAELPDVALLDWSMAGQDIDLTTRLMQSDLYGTSIIFLTVSESAQQKREMLKLGAHASLCKWCSATKVRQAVWAACKDKMECNPATDEWGSVDSVPVSTVSDAERRIKQLTRRELQLLPLVCRGLKNKEIALQLGIAESTVWHHLTSVFAKLHVEDRLGLVNFAYCHRLGVPAPRWPPASASNTSALGAFHLARPGVFIATEIQRDKLRNGTSQMKVL
jgi:DNA-binding NarL/FixJ family response regulator